MVHLRDGAWCTAGLFSHVQWKTQPWSSAVALSVPDIELNTTPTEAVNSGKCSLAKYVAIFKPKTPSLCAHSHTQFAPEVRFGNAICPRCE